ncbi:arsenate reductase family protein [Kroppenstedtia pulmonis]|uniref:Arsenate reductase family protein n=1 Tax=Kroppenstedtia pulmonis TaxID=1380685 RepID=A0A7D4BEF9_9BACL|nr:arsenate reductase family protein [Kroppenstedtia pulmonis]QKG83512.1 arsenate reductase family protein [Kroppenstedtia pulmonis]
MSLTLYQYPKCGTCRKAKKYLESKGIHFETKHIVEEPPAREELEMMVRQSGLDIKKFFNTSGRRYRELQLKDRLKEMREEEMLDLLSSDGMLLKRPILTDGKQVTVGFKEETYQQVWG